MKRRALLVTGAAMAGSLLGGRAAQAAVQWPMFEWERQGGVVGGVMVPPLLAVYGDGEAYADAESHQYLSAQEATSLRTHAVQVLRKRANLRRLPDFDPPKDAPTDQVRVRTADGHYLTAHLAGWGEGDPRREFPEALHELYDHLEVIRRRVRADGGSWHPDALIVAAVHLDVEPDEFEQWPTGVPVPAVGPDRIYRETKLSGGKARKVRRDLPRSGDQVWPFYRTPAGAFIAANWRYSLPHEW